MPILTFIFVQTYFSWRHTTLLFRDVYTCHILENKQNRLMLNAFRMQYCVLYHCHGWRIRIYLIAFCCKVPLSITLWSSVYGTSWGMWHNEIAPTKYVYTLAQHVLLFVIDCTVLMPCVVAVISYINGVSRTNWHLEGCRLIFFTCNSQFFFWRLHIHHILGSNHSQFFFQPFLQPNQLIMLLVILSTRLWSPRFLSW